MAGDLTGQCPHETPPKEWRLRPGQGTLRLREQGVWVCETCHPSPWPDEAVERRER